MSTDIKEIRSQLSNGRLNKNLQRFFEISPNHGCSYIGFRVSIFEAIFWTIAILACSCLFINDLVTLCQKYAAQTTAVSVTLQRNQSLNLTDAAVCFDVFRYHLAGSVSGAFSEPQFNLTLKNISRLVNASGGIIDLSTLPLLDPGIDMVLKTIYLLVAAIVDYDLGTPGGGLGRTYDDRASRAVDLVDAFFKEQGYGYDLLSEQTARYLCKQATMYFEKCALNVSGDDNFCIDLCATANVTWVGYTMAFAPFDDLCFALNTPNMSVFRSSADIFVFDTVYVSGMSILQYEWVNWSLLNLHGYGAPHLSFDMRGWRGFMDPRDMDSLAFIADGTGFLVGVEIQSEFRAYNHTWGNCGTRPQSDCALFTCLPAARMIADGCWPLAGYSLTAASKPAQVPICGVRYTTAQINQTSSSFVGNWETCLYQKCTTPPCVSFEYDYEVSLTSTAASGVNATLYQGKLSYTVFEEYLAMDSNAFLAALGGSLGLWLGGSLISVGHIPIYIFFSLVLNWRMKRQENAVKQSTTMVVADKDLATTKSKA